jgi:hypothetical protein
MILYLLKVHLQTFLSIPITQKCQILSCDTLVANKRYGEKVLPVWGKWFCLTCHNYSPNPPAGQSFTVQHFTAHSPHQTSVISAPTSLFLPLILWILQRNEFHYVLTLHSSNRYRNSNIRTTHIRSVFSTGAEKYTTQNKCGGRATALPNLLSLHIFLLLHFILLRLHTLSFVFSMFLTWPLAFRCCCTVSFLKFHWILVW